MRLHPACPIVAFALVLAGCSGGGTAGTTGASPSTQAFGTVTSNVVLTQDPVWIRGGTSTVYGLVGSITDSTYYNLEPGIDDTQLVIRDKNLIKAVDYEGGYTVKYPQTLMPDNAHVSIDKYGLIYFDTNAGVSLTRLNTQNRTYAGMRTGLESGAAVNFAGTKCAFARSTGVYTSNLDGTSEGIRIGTPGAPDEVRYIGDNSLTYTLAGNPRWYNLTASNWWYVSADAGTSPTGNWDDTQYAYSLVDGSVRFVSQNGTTAAFPQGAPNTAVAMCPDGSRFGVINGAQLRTQNILDGTSNTVSLFESGTAMVWGYLPRNIKLVGTGSNYFTSAAGVATGMKKGVPRSFAMWDVLTRTTARLRDDVGNVTGGTLVLTAEADRFTNFKYTNDRRGYATGLGMGATTNSVTIVFDDATGKIMTVIPASVTRGAGAKVARSGKDVTLTGSFEAVYDGEGNNIAPTGATAVSVVGGKLNVK